MRFLGARTDGLAAVAPVVIRLVVGVVMFAHGMQKLNEGLARFATVTLVPLGVPSPDGLAYVVAFTELVGGVLLVAGLLSRLAALALLVEMATTITLVKSHVGLIAAPAHGAGAELDLALAAGMAAILLAGPGRASLDYLLRIER